MTQTKTPGLDYPGASQTVSAASPTDSAESNALSIPQLAPDVDVLTAALAYAGAGWYVLPVRRGTKSPGSVVGDDWHHKSSRDPQQLVEWFAACDHGIVLHCGRSGGLALDVDEPDALPDALRRHVDSAPCQSTRPDTPGRNHYVFAMPPGRTFGNSTGRLGGAWGEVRGLNGVIMAAPSFHPDGGEYRWQRVGPVPVLPAEVAALLDDASPASDAASDAAVLAFLAEHGDSSRPGVLNGMKAALRKRFDAGESRHQSAATVMPTAMKEARAGYYSAREAVNVLGSMFVAEVAKPPASDKQRAPRNEPAAIAEFEGIAAWAIGQALAADLAEVHARVARTMHDNRAWADTPKSVAAPRIIATEPVSLAAAHATFHAWFGAAYDTDALDAVLAAAAVERLDGDPLWLLVISGSGMTKTETVQSLDGTGAIITSTISSCGALLSATSRKERAKDATGGLLRKLEPGGVLVIKDFTSILSMSGDDRAEVLGAFREVYDGRWSRNVGTDGGRTLEWLGRIAVVGAVTTAWDKAHAAIASMGDRFVLVRIDSTTGRQAAGRKAIANTGHEVEMRAELAAVVGGVLAGINADPITVSETETNVLLAAADLVTKARTGVEYDYRGDVIDAHAPEAPTRFAKQLAQVVRGGVAIGMDRSAAMRLAIRCARDSMPPLRLAIIDDVAAHPDDSTAAIRKRLGKPRATVDRQLQALHMLGVLDCDERDETWAGKDVTRWYYRLAADVDPTALDAKSVPDLALPTPRPLCREVGVDAKHPGVHTPRAISGTALSAGCDISGDASAVVR